MSGASIYHKAGRLQFSTCAELSTTCMSIVEFNGGKAKLLKEVNPRPKAAVYRSSNSRIDATDGPYFGVANTNQNQYI